jgi:cytochrome c-type biogenesis protein CcmH/NrfG
METERLNTVREIRGLLFIFVGVFCVWALFAVLAKLTHIYRNFAAEREEIFRRMAESLSSQGKMAEMKDHCLERLENYPNDISAMLWLAKAYFRSGEHEQALAQFEVLALIAPHWAEDYDPYIRSINESKNI